MATINLDDFVRHCLLEKICHSESQQGRVDAIVTNDTRLLARFCKLERLHLDGDRFEPEPVGISQLIRFGELTKSLYPQLLLRMRISMMHDTLRLSVCKMLKMDMVLVQEHGQEITLPTYERTLI